MTDQDKFQGGEVFGDEPWRRDRMHLVRAAILPEIRFGVTWHHIELACNALIAARYLADSLKAEEDHLAGGSEQTKAPEDTARERETG